MVDEQNAFEVVHLVLQARREQSLEVFLMGVPVEILVAHRAGRRAVDIGVDFRDRKTALLISRNLVSRVQDNRIDENPRLVAMGWALGIAAFVFAAIVGFGVGIFGLQINNQHAFGNADLDSR